MINKVKKIVLTGLLSLLPAVMAGFIFVPALKKALHLDFSGNGLRCTGRGNDTAEGVQIIKTFCEVVFFIGGM